MLSSLQEISRNVDTIALAVPHDVPDMHGLDKVWPGTSSRRYISLIRLAPSRLVKLGLQVADDQALLPNDFIGQYFRIRALALVCPQTGLNCV